MAMMAQPSDNRGATVREWTDVVRRSRLGRTTKAVALALATYADANGSRVFPGIARLSFDCELGYNVVQQCLAKLRHFKLIELVHQGTTRGTSDEYRLTIPDDLTERVTVPNPNQARKEIEAIRDRRRGKHKPAEPVDNFDLHPTATGAGIRTSREPAPNGVVPILRPAPNGVVRLHPTPLAPTSHYLDTTTTHHSDSGPRTTVTVPRARDPDTRSIPSEKLAEPEAA